MPAKNHDLHGAVPQQSRVVLLLIDVINDLEFEGGDDLLRHALPAAKKIAALKRRARESGVATVYVNDNFGRWRSDFRALVQHAQDPGVRGYPIATLLAPDADDYFVLKPKHSAFFGTSLDLLLGYLQATTVVLTGFAGDICVLFTAQDAFLRDFHVIVASDCTASESAPANRTALAWMATRLHADVRSSPRVDFARLARARARPVSSRARRRA